MRRIYLIEKTDRWSLVCHHTSRLVSLVMRLPGFRVEATRLGNDFNYVRITR